MATSPSTKKSGTDLGAPRASPAERAGRDVGAQRRGAVGRRRVAVVGEDGVVHRVDLAGLVGLGGAEPDAHDPVDDGLELCGRRRPAARQGVAPLVERE
jgi:hypothetical protein